MIWTTEQPDWGDSPAGCGYTVSNVPFRTCGEPEAFHARFPDSYVSACFVHVPLVLLDEDLIGIHPWCKDGGACWVPGTVWDDDRCTLIVGERSGLAERAAHA